MDDPLTGLDPPDKPDFRRIGPYNLPYVLDTKGERKRYRRPSTAGKILDDESALVDWRIRTVLVGAAQRPSIMAQISTYDPERDKKKIRDAAEECLVAGKGTERQVTGTAIHAMLDHVDLDHDWIPAPQFMDAVGAYVQALEVYGLVPVDVEVHCINDEFRIAGTVDRRYRTTRNLVAPDGTIIPIGSMIVGDTKTGKALEYASGSYATQIAGYVGSLRYDVETDERSEFDPPTFPEWALIMHVDAEAARCDVYWVDVTAGREGLALSERVRAWRARTDLITPAPAPIHAVPVPAAPAEEPARDAAVPAADASAVTSWLRERATAIKAHSLLALGTLQREWPMGVPGLRADGHTDEQLARIEKAIDAVEARFSMPFGAPDPRVREEPRSIVDRWARPKPDDAPTDAERADITIGLAQHSRHALLVYWSTRAQAGGNDPNVSDRFALAHAMCEFASVGREWTDAQLTEMLDGSLRSMNYYGGIDDLGKVSEADAPMLMAYAMAVGEGRAMLMYAEDGTPRVRFPVTTNQ